MIKWECILNSKYHNLNKNIGTIESQLKEMELLVRKSKDMECYEIIKIRYEEELNRLNKLIKSLK